MKYKIAVIPGDGIGPEVTGEAVRALEAVAASFGHQFAYEYVQAGGAAIGNELKRLREQVRRLETENQELKRSKVTSIHQNARTR